jgi:ornithine carbamoyltransferase
MASKTLLIDEKAVHQEGNTIALATASLAGRDLCSIADLSRLEIAAIMELAHAIKASPADYRFSLDARAGNA